MNAATKTAIALSLRTWTEIDLVNRLASFETSGSVPVMWREGVPTEDFQRLLEAELVSRVGLRCAMEFVAAECTIVRTEREKAELAALLAA